MRPSKQLAPPPAMSGSAPPPGAWQPIAVAAQRRTARARMGRMVAHLSAERREGIFVMESATDGLAQGPRAERPRRGAHAHPRRPGPPRRAVRRLLHQRVGHALLDGAPPPA